MSYRSNRYLNQDEDCAPDFKCDECGDLCDLEEETFDYGGTHCTNGNGGTHRTGIYSSKCCESSYEAL